MSGMIESAHAIKNKELLGLSNKRIVLHVPSNHRYAINLELEGAGVEIEDLENRILYVTWEDWKNNEIWSKQS